MHLDANPSATVAWENETLTDLNDMQRELARDPRIGLDEMASELLTCFPPTTVVDVLFGAAITLGDDQLGRSRLVRCLHGLAVEIQRDGIKKS